MKTGVRPDFAELLAEAGGCAAAGMEEKREACVPEPIRVEDGLSLSLQARKAIPRDHGKKDEKRAQKDQESLSMDWQGNKVHLSASGLGMAAGAAEKVAWETRLEKKKQSG